MKSRVDGFTPGRRKVKRKMKPKEKLRGMPRSIGGRKASSIGTEYEYDQRKVTSWRWQWQCHRDEMNRFFRTLEPCYTLELLLSYMSNKSLDLLVLPFLHL